MNNDDDDHDKQGHWGRVYAAEVHVARAQCRSSDDSGWRDFHGILCNHALIMTEALQPHPQRSHFALGMLLGVVHCNWIALLRMRVAREHGDTLQSISDLLARSSQLLVALITEDKLCTMAELTKSEELEAIACMRTRMGLLCKDMLKFFRAYVGSLCDLYHMQFPIGIGGANANNNNNNEKLARARYWVLFHAMTLGRMLDNVLENT